MNDTTSTPSSAPPASTPTASATYRTRRVDARGAEIGDKRTVIPRLPLPTSPRRNGRLLRGGSWSMADRRKAIDLYATGASAREVMRVTGINDTTVLRWVREEGQTRPRRRFLQEKEDAFSNAVALALNAVIDGCPVQYAIQLYDVSRSALQRRMLERGVVATLPLERRRKSTMATYIRTLQRLLNANHINHPPLPSLEAKDLYGNLKSR